MIGFLSFILLVASLPVSVRGAYRAQLTRARFFVSFQASVLARVTRNRRPRARESDEDERRARARARARESPVETHVRTANVCAVTV